MTDIIEDMTPERLKNIEARFAELLDAHVAVSGTPFITGDFYAELLRPRPFPGDTAPPDTHPAPPPQK